MNNQGLPVISSSSPQLNVDSNENGSNDVESQKSIFVITNTNNDVVEQNKTSTFYKAERNSSVPNFAQCQCVPRSPSINVQIDLNDLKNRDDEVAFSHDVLNCDNSSNISGSVKSNNDANSTSSNKSGQNNRKNLVPKPLYGKGQNLTNANMENNNSNDSVNNDNNNNTISKLIAPPTQLENSPRRKTPKVPKCISTSKQFGAKSANYRPKTDLDNLNNKNKRKSQIPTHLYETSLHRYPAPNPKRETNRLNCKK